MSNGQEGDYFDLGILYIIILLCQLLRSKSTSVIWCFVYSSMDWVLTTNYYLFNKVIIRFCSSSIYSTQSLWSMLLFRSFTAY